MLHRHQTARRVYRTFVWDPRYVSKFCVSIDTICNVSFFKKLTIAIVISNSNKLHLLLFTYFIFPGLCSRLLLAFSVRSNGRKVLATDAPPRDSIACIHGLRFLSLAWIIMVHTYMQLYAVADNKRLRNITERNYLYQTVGNATFSVDTFFFIR